MAAQTQRSIISYAPQPYFIEGSQFIAKTGLSDPMVIENEDGLFDPDLSNYTTIIPEPGEAEFVFNSGFARNVAYGQGMPVTCAYIGCTMLTYEDDGGGNPNYDTEFVEDTVIAQSWTHITTSSGQKFSFAKNSPNRVVTFNNVRLPGIVSGGTTNVLFSGTGVMNNTSTGNGQIVVSRTAANVALRPHVRFQIGHMFIGIDVEIELDPRAFSWSLQSLNRRFKARDQGAVSTDGTLHRQASFEARLLTMNEIMGVSFNDDFEAILSPNLLDLIKANNGYPVLFNPWPVVAPATGSLTGEQATLTARQNFFSIYGFLDGALDLQNSEYRNGLDSKYKARFRITETR